MTFIDRVTDLKKIRELQTIFPVVSIIGARQCGKTTLARLFNYQHYFDLENPRDLARLNHPQLALEDLTGLIVIDEIQRKPDLFPLLRVLVDQHRNRNFLILESAGGSLLIQSSESLAGRIGYYYLNGFGLHDTGSQNWKNLWFRGGLPRSFLADSDSTSSLWRENYIRTFLERDIPNLGIRIPSYTLNRFWTMICHYHGNLINYSEIGRSFGISDMTCRKYLEILQQTYMVRQLQPWYRNIGKRIVKHPKIYFRDSGILHYFLTVESLQQLSAHPKLGASWEGFALDTVCRSIGKRDDAFYFWRTHNGAELDLYWEHNGHGWGIEFKYADAPRVTPSMINTLRDLNMKHLWVVYPGKSNYSLSENIDVLSISHIPVSWVYPR